MAKTRHPVISLVLLALAGVACDGTVTDPASPSAEDVPEIIVRASEFSFDMGGGPFPGGRIQLTLQNYGEKRHDLQPLRVEGERTADQAIAASAARFEKGKGLPTWVLAEGGVGEQEPTASATVTLDIEPGTYAFVCFVGNHAERGMWNHVTFYEGDVQGLPDADATITAKDYTFTNEGIATGEQTVRFENDGPQYHFLSINAFPGGVTLEQATEDIDRLLRDEDLRYGELEEVGAFQIIEPGVAGTFTANWESGRVYAFVCWINDREGGQPHALKGMIVPFELT